MQPTKFIYDLGYDELGELIKSWGEPAYRLSQVWDGLYKQLWSTPDEFLSLPKALRHNLADNLSITPSGDARQITLTSITPIRKLESSDGETIKTLFSLPDGQTIEAVLMKYAKRRTLCISTQAGCSMGCVFCATGQMGFRRQLSSGEIIQQVLYYARQLAEQSEQVTNVVIMGMGEPFHNFNATMSAIERLNHPVGFNLGARRFTISTVGLVPGIRRFTQEHSQVNLAISLHAADDSLRSQLLPINRKYPLDVLFAACREYIHATRRRLSFEWALIQDVNDTPEQAHLLVQRLEALRLHGSNLCHVNVIPLNPTQKYNGRATTHAKALAFKKIIEAAGIPCTIRLRRGIDIQAGCGQLAGEKNK